MIGDKRDVISRALSKWGLDESLLTTLYGNADMEAIATALGPAISQVTRDLFVLGREEWEPSQYQKYEPSLLLLRCNSACKAFASAPNLEEGFRQLRAFLGHLFDDRLQDYLFDIQIGRAEDYHYRYLN